MSFKKKIITASIATLALIPVNGMALGLGEVETLSQINQNLDVRLKVLGASSLDKNSLKATVPTQHTRFADSFYLPFSANDLELSLIKSTEGELYLHITSNNRINEPHLSFPVSLSHGDVNIARLVTILLDPAISQDSNKSHNHKKFTKSETMYGPVKSGESLFSIVKRNEHSDQLTKKIAIATFLKNKDAFLNHNINKLMTGSYIQLATVEDSKNISNSTLLTYFPETFNTNTSVNKPDIKHHSKDLSNNKAETAEKQVNLSAQDQSLQALKKAQTQKEKSQFKKIESKVAQLTQTNKELNSRLRKTITAIDKLKLKIAKTENANSNRSQGPSPHSENDRTILSKQPLKPDSHNNESKSNSTYSVLAIILSFITGLVTALLSLFVFYKRRSNSGKKTQQASTTSPNNHVSKNENLPILTEKHEEPAFTAESNLNDTVETDNFNEDDAPLYPSSTDSDKQGHVEHELEKDESESVDETSDEPYLDLLNENSGDTLDSEHDVDKDVEIDKKENSDSNELSGDNLEETDEFNLDFDTESIESTITDQLNTTEDTDIKVSSEGNKVSTDFEDSFSTLDTLEDVSETTSEFNFNEDSADEIMTKLDLAEAYADMNDQNSASDLINEIYDTLNTHQKERADRILSKAEDEC